MAISKTLTLTRKKEESTDKANIYSCNIWSIERFISFEYILNKLSDLKKKKIIYQKFLSLLKKFKYLFIQRKYVCTSSYLKRFVKK